MLYLCLNIGKNRPISESVMKKGRTDLVKKTQEGNWFVVEVKHEKPPKNVTGENVSYSQETPHSVRVLGTEIDTLRTNDAPVVVDSPGKDIDTSRNNNAPAISDSFAIQPPPGAASGAIETMKLAEAAN